MFKQLTRCWAEIDSAALASNISLLKSLGPEIIAVVKADAYGHGVDIIVPLLREANIQHFSVATVDEASLIRELPGMADVSIYLMAAVLSDEADRIVHHDLIPFATDTTFVEALSKSALAAAKRVRVHVEVDTGIGRAGVAPDDLLETIRHWRSLPGVYVTGICTHFTAADADSISDSSAQLQKFHGALNGLPDEIRAGLAIHAANSPGALRLPVGGMTFFRPGLLMYGIPPSGKLGEHFPYSPVMTLKARVLLLRRLPQGSDISYSRTYTLTKDANVATIGIGYGDGYPRRLSNIGKVILPDGTTVPIRGRVCMDQLCVELPDSAVLSVGDEVTLIGSVENAKISATDIAEVIGATPHEIPTSLTARVKRVKI